MTADDIKRIRADTIATIWRCASQFNCGRADDKETEREIAEVEAVFKMALANQDDAARYRWLNAKHDMLLRLNESVAEYVALSCGDALDAFIDSRIKVRDEPSAR